MVSGSKARERRRAAAAQKAAAIAPVRLPAAGHPRTQVQVEHKRYATALMADGVIFPKPPAVPDDLSAALQLVRNHIKDPDTGPHDFTLVAKSAQGEVVGALVCQLIGDDDSCVVMIRYLVTRPDWRGRGVGYVLVGQLPQFAEDLGGNGRTISTVGNCAPERAGYFQRLGFTVRAPGESISIPLLGQAALPDDADEPCWFQRDY